MDLTKILVLIPAYNEETTISGVIENLKSKGFSHILVVNDGSADSTEAIAKQHNVLCISHVVNLGYGGGLKTGFDWVVKQGTKYDYLLTLDADGQHNIDDALKLVEKAVTSNADYIIGRRSLRSKNIPKMRKLALFLADMFILALTFKPIKDTFSGLRCIKVSKLPYLNIKMQNFTVCIEILWLAVKNSLSFEYVPVNTIYTEYSMNKSHGLKMSDSINLVKEFLS